MSPHNALRWRLSGASVRGPSHERTGLPCQDAHRVVFAEGCVILCVADGAGSVPRADEGAQLAVAAASESLERAVVQAPDQSLHADLAVIEAAFAAARSRLHEHAQEEQSVLRDYACTLSVVLITPSRALVGQVGDGAVVGRRDGQLEVWSEPERREYANETSFLTDDGWRRSLRVSKWNGRTDAACSFTDGSQRMLLELGDTVRPFAQFFAPLFAFAMQSEGDDALSLELALMLDSPRFRAHSDDDKTIAVALLLGDVASAQP